MTGFIPYATATIVPGLRRSRGWLVFFGVIALLLSALAWLGTLVIGAQLSRFLRRYVNGWMTLTALAETMLIFLFFAGWAVLLTMAGIGSIRCRRWVRPVVLAIGWPVMIATALLLAGWLLMARDYSRMFNLPAGSYALRVLSIFGVIVSIVMFVFGILLPAGFVLFFSTRAARQTLEACDPGPSWTERCPLRLFILAVDLLLFGLGTLMMLPTLCAPCFGLYVSGPYAIALMMACALGLAVAGAMCYLRMIGGWWLGMIIITGGYASAIVTLVRLGMVEFYTRGGLLFDLVHALELSPTMSGATPIVFLGIAMAISIGYIASTYRLFARPEQALVSIADDARAC